MGNLAYKVNIVHPDGTREFLNMAHSQLCELTRELSRADKRRLTRGERVELPDGTTVREVGTVIY